MEDVIMTQGAADMEAVADIVSEDLATVKTGRAKPDLIAQVMVEAYGTKTPIIELASISAPDPHLLIVQPWDDSVTENIARAVFQSQLNLTAVVDRNVVRIPIPPLTEERREEFVKLVGQKIESGRVMLRQVRQEIKKDIENMKGKPGISEDDIHRLLEELEKLMDRFMEKIEILGKTKAEELRQI